MNCVIIIKTKVLPIQEYAILDDFDYHIEAVCSFLLPKSFNLFGFSIFWSLRVPDGG